MAANVLMVVHGMGVHEAGWEAEVRAKLEEVAGRYDAFRGDPARLWQELKLVPIGYDDLIRQTLDQWKAQAADVVGFATAQELVGAPDLSWLGELAAQDEAFLWSHVADVVIYRFFKLQRAAIRASVARQIVEAVPQVPDRDFDRCVVLAHSLGTAVAHDSLHLLATRPIAGFPSAFGPLDARWRGIFFLANVSRLLQTDDAKAYESVVHGGRRDSKSSNCGLFRSIAHELDPICIPKRFAPEGWSVRFNAVRTVNHLRDWNVHGLLHYLDNPRVHIPLLNVACGRNVVAPAERRSAVDGYERFGGKLRTVPQVQATLREIGAELQRLHENADLKTLFDVFRRVKDHLEGLRALVDGLRAELEADLKKGLGG